MPGRFTPDVLLELPRLSDLRLAPDGRSLVFVVACRNADGTKYVSDLHRVAVDPVDPVEGGAVERLTVGDTSDHAPRFLADGSLVFLTTRADNDPKAKAGAKSEGDDELTPQVWHLPLRGEPRPLTRRALGIDALETAGGTLAFASYVFPGAATDADNRSKKKARKESGVSALEFDAIPFRFWDRFHGPRHRHLLAQALSPDGAANGAAAQGEARDLTPEARLDVDEQSFDVSEDGKRICVSFTRQVEEHRQVENLVLIDAKTGKRTTLTDALDSYTAPRFSPDGTHVACIFHENVEAKTGRTMLALIDIEQGTRTLLTEALDLWPNPPVFSRDGKRLYFTADERGEVPIFAIELATRAVRRVSQRGGFSDLCPSPDGRTVYALYSTWDHPPEVVAVDADATDGAPRRLTHLSDALLKDIALGKVEALVTKAADGREVHSFLMHPPTDAGHPTGATSDDATPKPLVLWVHGGPIGAWSNHWHFRWNPHLFAARGQRVLLVNPRISLGYGQTFVEEGFNRWGGEPFTDLVSALDAACKRPDVDPKRTAVMGGSFGGYMVNWMLGQTARFRCAVSHAGLWDLPSFHGTTDCGPEWEREFGNPYQSPEQYDRWSPHRFVDKVKTPTLVVHGERDYRVPVSEAYMMFTALQRNGVPSKFLYFPDENHWILKPPNSRAWHEAIFAWLDRWLAQ